MGDKEVIVTFRWPYDANSVELCGSFSQWKERYKLHKDDSIWITRLSLNPGIYQYKFIIDDVNWYYDVMKPYTSNNGYVNNVLWVFEPVLQSSETPKKEQQQQQQQQQQNQQQDQQQKQQNQQKQQHNRGGEKTEEEKARLAKERAERKARVEEEKKAKAQAREARKAQEEEKRKAKEAKKVQEAEKAKAKEEESKKAIEATIETCPPVDDVDNSKITTELFKQQKPEPEPGSSPANKPEPSISQSTEHKEKSKEEQLSISVDNVEGSPKEKCVNKFEMLERINNFWNDTIIKQLHDEIDMKRWKNIIGNLASINRYSFGTGIDKAKELIIEELKKIDGLEVTVQKFVERKKNLENVIGILKGTDQPDSIFIIGGHYDSISEDPSISAPGAIDNATGTAAVIEMARIFSKHKPKVTLWFILFPGEEQGYYGSKAHVRDCDCLNKIKMMLNLDMIGWNNPRGNIIEIETMSQYANISQLFALAAEQFCSLGYIVSLHAWGSDHVTYIRQNIPAVLTTNKDCVDYPDYHRTTDTIEHVHDNTAEQFIRMNLATFAQFCYNNIDPAKLLELEIFSKSKK